MLFLEHHHTVGIVPIAQASIQLFTQRLLSCLYNRLKAHTYRNERIQLNITALLHALTHALLLTQIQFRFPVACACEINANRFVA